MCHPLCGEWPHAAGHEDLPEVGFCQTALISCVEAREQCSQFEVGWHLTLMRDQQEDCLLELRHPHVSIHALHNAYGQCRWNIVTSFEPHVIKAVRRKGSLAVILLEHPPQEVAAGAADVSEALVI